MKVNVMWEGSKEELIDFASQTIKKHSEELPEAYPECREIVNIPIEKQINLLVDNKKTLGQVFYYTILSDQIKELTSVWVKINNYENLAKDMFLDNPEKE